MSIGAAFMKVSLALAAKRGWYDATRSPIQQSLVRETRPARRAPKAQVSARKRSGKRTARTYGEFWRAMARAPCIQVGPDHPPKGCGSAESANPISQVQGQRGGGREVGHWPQFPGKGWRTSSAPATGEVQRRGSGNFSRIGANPQLSSRRPFSIGVHCGHHPETLLGKRTPLYDLHVVQERPHGRLRRLGHAGQLRLADRGAPRGAPRRGHVRRLAHVRDRRARCTRARVFLRNAARERRRQAHGLPARRSTAACSTRPAASSTTSSSIS